MMHRLQTVSLSLAGTKRRDIETYRFASETVMILNTIFLSFLNYKKSNIY